MAFFYRTRINCTFQIPVDFYIFLYPFPYSAMLFGRHGQTTWQSMEMAEKCFLLGTHVQKITNRRCSFFVPETNPLYLPFRFLRPDFIRVHGMSSPTNGSLNEGSDFHLLYRCVYIYIV